MNEEWADSVTIEYAQADDTRLAEWVARYPEHARALAQVAYDRWVPASPDPGNAAAVQAIGMQVLRERRAAYAVALTSLKAAAEARGTTLAALADTLRLPVGLFWKLHRRLIAAETIPQTLIERLADGIGHTAAELTAYLRQPPQLAVGASYRSDATPAAATESFAQALADDPETIEAMKQEWL